MYVNKDANQIEDLLEYPLSAYIHLVVLYKVETQIDKKSQSVQQ